MDTRGVERSDLERPEGIVCRYGDPRISSGSRECTELSWCNFLALIHDFHSHLQADHYYGVIPLCTWRASFNEFRVKGLQVIPSFTRAPAWLSSKMVNYDMNAPRMLVQRYKLHKDSADRFRRACYDRAKRVQSPGQTLAKTQILSLISTIQEQQLQSIPVAISCQLRGERIFRKKNALCLIRCWRLPKFLFSDMCFGFFRALSIHESLKMNLW